MLEDRHVLSILADSHDQPGLKGIVARLIVLGLELPGEYCDASDGVGKSFEKIWYSKEIPHEQKEASPFSPDQKVAILKKHLVGRKPVSDIGDEFKIHPTQFYQWQKVFFESGHHAFELTDKASTQENQRKMAELKDQMKRK